jgi:hypothetical protein
MAKSNRKNKEKIYEYNPSLVLFVGDTQTSTLINLVGQTMGGY